MLIDTSINVGEAAKSNGKFAVVAQLITKKGPDHYGAIVPKDSTNAGAFNAVLEQLRSSGELAKLAADAHVGPSTPIPTISVP